MPELPSPLIDILSAESFAAEHLPGSVNICVYETAFIDKIRAAFPDPNTALTVYGLNDSTLEAGVALTKLGTAGYMRVSTLPGGLEGWKASGGNVEQSAAPELPSGQFEVDQKASLVEWMGRILFNRHVGTVQLGPGQGDQEKTGAIPTSLIGCLLRPWLPRRQRRAPFLVQNMVSIWRRRQAPR
jgi:rhodanese-related sulfurtransferase